MAGQALDTLPKYWTIGRAEQYNLNQAMKRSLSGYVGGYPSTGYWVNQLSDDWKAEFNVNFAIPCNSATSGLMAACMATGIGPGDEVWVSTYTMSASATCAMILGANVKFIDIESQFFCMQLACTPQHKPKAIIVTNLFGCAAELPLIRSMCDDFNIIMIEDNAQAPYATCGGAFTGTIGHMGVFSLNVHKHIQCGEGGVIVTDDPALANKLEGAINHGELNSSGIHPSHNIGLNARMVEPIAAIACAQLKKGLRNVQTRIELAETISDMFREVPFVTPPAKRFGEVHVYYLWAGKITGEFAAITRYNFISRLVDRGVPFRVGYSPLLHELFDEDYSLPVAEEMENERLFTFEVCAYDPKLAHLKRMREIILKEAEVIERKGSHDTRGSGSDRSRRDAGEVLGSH